MSVFFKGFCNFNKYTDIQFVIQEHNDLLGRFKYKHCMSHFQIFIVDI